MTATFVNDFSSFNSMMNFLEKAEVIAFDTEFFREVTFYPKIGLLQLAANGEIFLVDPFGDFHFHELIKFMVMTDATVICHACAEDLEIVAEIARRENYHRLLPKKIFDTQVAAAFLGEKKLLGLSFLTEKFLGVKLAKTETRTDWLKRPLTPEQMEYAAYDVAYLEKLRHYFLIKFRDLPDNHRWFLMEMEELSASEDETVAPEELYLSIPKTGRFKASELRILQAITMLREKICRETDTPPSFFIRNNVLVDLIQTSKILDARTYLKNGVHYTTVEKYGTLIQTTARAASAKKDLELNPTYDAVKYFQSAVKKRDELKKHITKIAAQTKISENYIGSRKMIEHFFYDPIYAPNKTPILTTGWRKECLGDLNKFVAN